MSNTNNAANYNLAAMTSTGIVKYDGTSLVSSTTAKIDSSNRMTNSSQPCFLVNLNTTITNATGNSAVVNLLFDTTTFDNGSNITLNSGSKTIFTAPVTGKYLFQGAITFSSLTTAMTNGVIEIFTTANTAITNSFNPGATKSSGNASTYNFSIILPMSATDTAYLITTIQNGAGNTAGFLGAASATPGYTFWSGHLIC